MGVRVRDGEDTKWVPTEEDVDLGKLGMAGLVEEYDVIEAQIKILAARRDAIKEAVKAQGQNLRILVNGQERFQVRKDGQFMSAQFRKEYPALFEDFTHRVSATEFNLEAFKKAMPALYEQFRASKLIRVNN